MRASRQDSPSYDPVTFPEHYNSSPAKCANCGHRIECIDITRHMNFNTGNAIKYIWRSALKGKLTEDLQKATFYLEDEIRRLEADGIQ